jgi:hypothetical protein
MSSVRDAWQHYDAKETEKEFIRRVGEKRFIVKWKSDDSYAQLSLPSLDNDQLLSQTYHRTLRTKGSRRCCSNRVQNCGSQYRVADTR